MRSAIAAALLFLAAPLAAPLAAQADREAESDPYVTLTGTVLDAKTGQPIAGAVVRQTDTERAVMTNREGRFALARVPVGPITLSFDQLGYTLLTLTQRAEAEAPPIRVELEPQPVVLDGLQVMADRMKARRQSTGVAVRLITADDFRASSVDLFRAVRTRAGVPMTPCSPRHRPSTWCAYVRGDLITPAVYIDDRPAWGVEELTMYRTDEIYAVEVYAAGRAIRVYTRDYVRHMAMLPRPIFPAWGPG